MRRDRFAIHAPAFPAEIPSGASSPIAPTIPWQDLGAVCAATGIGRLELPASALPELSQSAAPGLRCVAVSGLIVRCFDDDEDPLVARRCEQEVFDAATWVDRGGGGVLIVRSDGCETASPLIALDVVGRVLAALVERLPPSVAMALEPEPASAVRDLASARIAVDAAGHPRVGICFEIPPSPADRCDIGDLNAEIIAKVLHIRVGAEPRRGAAGGLLDLRLLLERIDAMGYRGCYSLGPPIDQATLQSLF